MTRYLAFALVLLAAGPAHAEEKTLDRTFAVSPGGTLTVDADSASVRVVGHDSNQVVVRIIVRGLEDELFTDVERRRTLRLYRADWREERRS